ncbi:GILT-like protein F37H8.5 [Trichinella pseudospiralis]|uniref:GILT-like protein F37H8.5 n=1 Tax=Trichinella pseudospiralis TaxID=6337 RepID=A0A0V1ET33_TRIPS|nr:GILT-like protein F37H8.5 [Trichinella pseudospiralis]
MLKQTEVNHAKKNYHAERIQLIAASSLKRCIAFCEAPTYTSCNSVLFSAQEGTCLLLFRSIRTQLFNGIAPTIQSSALFVAILACNDDFEPPIGYSLPNFGQLTPTVYSTTNAKVSLYHVHFYATTAAIRLRLWDTANEFECLILCLDNFLADHCDAYYFSHGEKTCLTFRLKEQHALPNSQYDRHIIKFSDSIAYSKEKKACLIAVNGNNDDEVLLNGGYHFLTLHNCSKDREVERAHNDPPELHAFPLLDEICLVEFYKPLFVSGCFHLMLSVSGCLLLWFLTISTSDGCNIPPALWCNSEKVATECEVLDSCLNYNTTQLNKKIKLTLLYETLCPDCQEFILNTLQRYVWKYGQDFVELNLIPYGNARRTKLNNTWTIQCQHGPVECALNKLHGCAISKLVYVEKWFPLIVCLEEAAKLKMDPDTAFLLCSKKKKLNQTLSIAIYKCAYSIEGDLIQLQMAEITENVKPHPHYFVPWILINDVSTAQLQTFQNGLFNFLCDWHRGSVPKGCADYSNLLKQRKNLQLTPGRDGKASRMLTTSGRWFANCPCLLMETVVELVKQLDTGEQDELLKLFMHHASGT